MRFFATLLVLACCRAALAADPAPPVPAPANTPKAYRPEDWAEPVGQAGQQFDLLRLLAKASHFGGITVKIPGELQRVPLEPLGLQDLQKKGIELYLKEITFRDLDFSREDQPKWKDTRPVLPAMMRFSTLGASIEAKTKIGMIPLGATFHDGALPFDFDFRKDGYDLGLLPEERVSEAKLDKVRLRVAGPIATGIVNAFFKDDVARLVFKYGVGQTLKMNEGGLFGGGTGASFLKMRSDSIGAQLVNGLADVVGGTVPERKK